MACTVDDLYRGSGGGLSLVTTSKSIPEGQGQAGSDGVTSDTFKVTAVKSSQETLSNITVTGKEH